MSGTGAVAAAAAATSVKLLIKASNQEFDDQIIDTELVWTVRRLKTHLSQVYPSNPAVSEQKLIYSGQLLSDNLMLKDVIRSYKDVDTQNHIFHLVYTPKNPPLITASKPKASAPVAASAAAGSSTYEGPSTSAAAKAASASADSTDGLRHRNTASASAQQNQQQQHNQAGSQATNTNKFTPQTMPASQYAQYYPQTQYPNAIQFSLPPQLNAEELVAMQAAMQNWLRLVYDQYMEYCLRTSTLPVPGVLPIIPPPSVTSIRAATKTSNPIQSKDPNAQQFNAAATSSHLQNPYLQQMPFFAQNVTTFGGNASTNNLATDFEGPSTSAAATARAASASSFHSSPEPAASSSTSNPIRAVPVIQSPANATAGTATAEQPLPPAQSRVTQEPQPAAAEAADPAAAQQIPRFPNIVQEEQDNRDWLDSFYSVIRLAALLTLAYFYSSPMRCLVVAIIAVGIYLYHNGVFHGRAPTEANNNNINNNRNNNPGANQIRQGVQEIQEQQQQQQQQQQTPSNQEDAAPSAAAEAAPEVVAAPPDVGSTAATNRSSSGSEEQSAATSNNVVREEDNNSTSVIAFIRTFVVSFFTSLLPETPAL